MDYQIIEKPSFHVIGKSTRVSTVGGENMIRIPQFWRESVSDGSLYRLETKRVKDGVTGGGTLGICKDFDGDMSEFSYMIAVEAPAERVTAEFAGMNVPAATWAVFQAHGALPDALQSVWGYVMSEFLPNGAYIHADAPDLEVYPPGDPMAEDYQCAVWLPIVKK